MNDISKLTASEILAVSTPEGLYTGNQFLAEREYRKLSSLWHPDRNLTASPDSLCAPERSLQKGSGKIEVWHLGSSRAVYLL